MRAARRLRDPARKTKAGENFTIVVPPATPAVPQAQAMDLAIVYEDAALIVVDKPAGLVVHPAPGNPDRTLVNALIAHCGPSLTGIGGVTATGHRPPARQGYQRADRGGQKSHARPCQPCRPSLPRAVSAAPTAH